MQKTLTYALSSITVGAGGGGDHVFEYLSASKTFFIRNTFVLEYFRAVLNDSRYSDT